jgi:hypothetical protein
MIEMGRYPFTYIAAGVTHLEINFLERAYNKHDKRGFYDQIHDFASAIGLEIFTSYPDSCDEDLTVIGLRLKFIADEPQIIDLIELREKAELLKIEVKNKLFKIGIISEPEIFVIPGYG